MDLIVKPTELCNFACTFCSSTQLTEERTALLDLKKIYQFLKRFPNTNTIIINGGDPLMVKPKYYFDILNYIEEHQLDTNLSFTTNLWDFYKNPKKWTELFKHPKVGVATSFNYGDTRRITKNKVFTEEIFWEVSDLFFKEIGYRPSFISVITDENADTAIKNVELAKKMNVECKLNYAMASGDQSKPFILSRIYEIYCEIFYRHLTPWEYNTKQMLDRLQKMSTTCPQSRTCDQGIRCLQPDGDYYSCGAFGDDKEYEISFEEEMQSDQIATPLRNRIELQSMKENCFTCPMFDICNGCKKTIRDLKKHDLVEEHCSRMKRLEPVITRIHNLSQEELKFYMSRSEHETQ